MVKNKDTGVVRVLFNLDIGEDELKLRHRDLSFVSAINDTLENNSDIRSISYDATSGKYYFPVAQNPDAYEVFGTGVAPNNVTENKTLELSTGLLHGALSYTVYLQDATGLSTPKTITGTLKKLADPVVFDSNQTDVVVSEGNNPKIAFSHDDGTGCIKLKRIPATEDNPGLTNIQNVGIRYTCQKENDSENIVTVGSNQLVNPYPVSITAKGNYTVKLWQEAPGYAASNEKIYSFSFYPTILFVSNTGDDDTGTGTKAKPYKTLVKALNDVDDKDEDWFISISGSISGSTSTISESVQAASLTIRGIGTNATLTGSSGRVLTISRSNTTANLPPVTLENLIITGGEAGISVAAPVAVTITDCMIKDMTGTENGVGLAIKGGSVVTLNGSTKITNCTLNIKDGKGGGVFVEDATLILKDNASIDGNIMNQENGTGIGIAIDSSADAHGKVFLCDTSSVINNKGTGPNSRGGGVYVRNGELYIGYTPDDDNKPVIDTNFAGKISNNSIEGIGGGVNVVGTCMMSSGTISGNTASNGGGVCVSGMSGSGTFTMIGGVIGKETEETATADDNSNSASESGGGLYLAEGCTFICKEDAKIMYNYAVVDGGGVYAEANDLTLEGCTISYNKATANGGGLYLAGAGENEWTMNTPYTISNNSADNGGGIYHDSGTVTMSDGTISDNTAENNGGGVYISNGAGIFTMTGGIIGENKNIAATSTGKSNWAKNNGGGVYVDGSFEMTGGQVIYNFATGSTNTEIAENGGGGGIFLCGSQTTLTLSGNATISYNGSGKHGGGLYLDGLNSGEGTTFTMSDNAAISFNKLFYTPNPSPTMLATHYGGGIYGIADSDTITFEGGKIENNSAELIGSSQYRITVAGTIKQEQFNVNNVATINLD